MTCGRARHVAALAAVLLAVAAPAAAGGAPEPAVARVDAVFAPWTGRDSPGCAVSVVRDGTPLLRRAYGMADLEQGRANTVSTVFEAGSVSKQITAAAVLLLAAEGRIGLDDPARRYLPELPDAAAAVTVRQMLTHTSGLRDWGDVVAAAGWPRGSRVYTQAHVLDVATRQRALNFTPGTRFSYSNTGYNLAAMAVERIAGRSFASFTRDRIFAPLGMTATSWRDDHTRVVPGRATAYVPRNGGGWSVAMPFEDAHGNGGLLTTVDDLQRWNANLAAAAVGGPELVAALQRPAVLDSGEITGYAAGLFVTTWRGVREIGHGGATGGYRAFLARYPGQRLSVALLCNAGDAGTAGLARRVAAIWLDGDLEPLPRVRAAVLAPAQLDALAGVYRSLGDGSALRLAVQDGGLVVGGDPVAAALSADRFVLGDGGGVLEVVRAGDGRPERVRIVADGGRAETFAAEAPWAPSLQELDGLAGVYRSDEAEAELVAVVGVRGLELHQRPATVHALLPAWRDAFTSPWGTVAVRRGADGTVVALSVITSRMWDLRFDRVGAGP